MKSTSLAFLLMLVSWVSVAQKQAAYEHLIIYGQSLSTGQQSWPPLSTSPIENNFMIGSQVWTNYNNPTTNLLNPLKANVAADKFMNQPKSSRGQLSCECPIVGTANYIQLKTPGRYKFIASSCGYGGKTIEQLSEEHFDPIHYSDFRNCISYASAISSSIHCPAIFWMQGEYNYLYGSDTITNGLKKGGTPTANKNLYKSLLLKLKNNMQHDIMVQYQQTDKPLFITYQVGKQYTKGNTLEIGMAQLEASNENRDIVCAGPVYWVPDRNGHLDPNGYRWYGELLGKVYYQTKVLKKAFKPLQPKKIVRFRASNKLRIDFLVPHAPLVIDTNLVKKTENYGFEIFVNGTKTEIESLFVEGNSVSLTCRNKLKGNIEVLYAGPNNKGCGNLRDSDIAIGTTNYIDLDKKDENGNYVFEREVTAKSLRPVYEPKDSKGAVLYDQPYPLYNFCVAFYYQLNAKSTSYNVPNV
ncbi:MAG TPA: hypothetical protein DEH15_14050 [Marinilabiliales bacterium]|nr:hypothetical protein [Marinilabiliales bacterium]